MAEWDHRIEFGAIIWKQFQTIGTIEGISLLKMFPLPYGRYPKKRTSGPFLQVVEVTLCLRGTLLACLRCKIDRENKHITSHEVRFSIDIRHSVSKASARIPLSDPGTLGT